jgi:hypothetical protein
VPISSGQRRRDPSKLRSICHMMTSDITCLWTRWMQHLLPRTSFWWHIICKTRFCYFGTYDAFKLTFNVDQWQVYLTHHAPAILSLHLAINFSPSHTMPVRMRVN